MEHLLAFPHSDIALKIVLALGVGLFIGLEREFASKDVGLRTFSFAALLGLLCQLIGMPFAIVGLVAVLCLTTYINTRTILANHTLEITTSISLIITFCLGILVGLDHVFAPVTVSILVTLLLAWKNELAAFAHGLQIVEIRSAIILGLVTFVIYPILPDRFIDPWNLLNPKEAWTTIIVLAGISFVNYVLLRVYSTKGLYYSALLGGAVNSSAAVTEISAAIKLSKGHTLPHALPILLMTTISMFVRNLVLLGIFERSSIAMALAPLLGMAATATFFVWRAHLRRDVGLTSTPPMKVSSPVSLARVLKVGLIFVTLQAAGTMGLRHLGTAGILSVSFLGGLLSSASTTAATANLAAHGMLTASLAGVATVIASIASAFINLPLVYQSTKDKTLTRNLGLVTFACIASGLVLMGLVEWVEPYFVRN